ncbi:hypothetical protein HG433_000440 [Candidatus Saccharibacteria bacterium]|nr:hypothetical protein [Candidatus Saccharibacteria bacterium]
MAKKNRELLLPQKQEQPSPDEQQSRRRKRGVVIASLALTTPLILHGIYNGLPDFYPGNDPLPACSDTELDDGADLGHDKPAVDHMRTLSDLPFSSQNEAWEHAFRDSGIGVNGYSEGAPALTATKVRISGGETDVLYSGVITYSANDREQGHPIVLTVVNTEDLENLTPDNTGIITIGSNESEFHPNGGCTMPMPGPYGTSHKHIVALTLAKKNENHAYRRTSRQMSLEVKNGIITTIAQDDLLEQPLTVVNYGSQGNERKIGKPVVTSGFVVGYDDATHTKTLLVSSEDGFDDRTGQGSPLFVQSDPSNPYNFQLAGLVVEGSITNPTPEYLKKVYNVDVSYDDIDGRHLKLITVTNLAITTDLVTHPDVTEKAAQDEAQQSTASNTSRSNLYASDKPRPYWEEPENQAHSIPKYYVDPNATSDKQPTRNNTAQL